MRHLIVSVLVLASVPAAAGELLPYNPGRAAVAPAARSAVVVDQSVYDQFTLKARSLTPAGRRTLQAQFDAQRVAAVAAHDAARAAHYSRLINILQILGT